MRKGYKFVGFVEFVEFIGFFDPIGRLDGIESVDLGRDLCDKPFQDPLCANRITSSEEAAH